MIGYDIHDKVDVFRRARRWDACSSRMKLNHEPADQNPIICVCRLDNVKDRAPWRQQIVVADVYRVCFTSHRCLISSSAARPAERSRVDVLLARSAAITASGA